MPNWDEQQLMQTCQSRGTVGILWALHRQLASSMHNATWKGDPTECLPAKQPLITYQTKGTASISKAI